MDNIELMKLLPSESIDLIYCDILYNTGKKFKDYEDKLGTPQQAIEWYIPRLNEMKRILKNTGSVYLQCDYRLVHYLKVKMDEIFNISNFRNEIIWCYNGASNDKKNFIKKHDTILWYSKSITYKFNYDDVRVPYNTETIARYSRNACGYALTNNDKDVLNKQGKIPEDWWQFCIIRNQAEKVDYCSQKPKAILERIIKASSDKGDIVADFFCGSGTACVVAKELGRNYIGCDISEKAINIAESRILAL